MTFGDVTTVGELIDALEHFDREMPVEMHYEFRIHEIAKVGVSRGDCYATKVVAITAKDTE